MNHYRQNLVPISNVESCSTNCDYERDGMFGKGDCYGKGFDSSGKYFTYSRISLSRTFKGPKYLFEIERVRDRERILALKRILGTRYLVRHREISR